MLAKVSGVRGRVRLNESKGGRVCFEMKVSGATGSWDRKRIPPLE